MNRYRRLFIPGIEVALARGQTVIIASHKGKITARQTAPDFIEVEFDDWSVGGRRPMLVIYDDET